MNGLPGFTAERSLYRPTELYAQTAGGAGTPGAEVVPQVCLTVPVCLPGINRKVRVCLSLFGGISWSFVSC